VDIRSLESDVPCLPMPSIGVWDCVRPSYTVLRACLNDAAQSKRPINYIINSPLPVQIEPIFIRRIPFDVRARRVETDGRESEKLACQDAQISVTRLSFEKLLGIRLTHAFTFMHALFRRTPLPRLLSTHVPSPIFWTVTRAHFPPPLHRIKREYHNQTDEESLDEEMGRKDKDDQKGGNFNLKVPKGTRDCRFAYKGF
jgi:hypothetical protein